MSNSEFQTQLMNDTLRNWVEVLHSGVGVPVGEMECYGLRGQYFDHMGS